MNRINTAVVICGAGPVGLIMAHLLGLDDIDVVLIEKLDNTVTEPRAIAIDGESLRTLQKTGLLEGFEDELLTGLTADYVNGDGELLFQAGSPEQRPYGYATVNSFDQPALDRYLAQSLERCRSVRLCFRHTLDRFEQDETGIRVYCTDAGGGKLEISADYLVGCDGGRSTIRSLLDIEMHGETNPRPWLVIDTRDPCLDGKLDCRFFCDPKRPGMTLRKRHGERRWEWMLMPGEEREQLLRDETIRDIIAPYTDVDQVAIYRKRVYDFHAIIAERWRVGRVFLAGDAAHMTPPFAGQGLNSGLRDVSNLSWKLAAVVRGDARSTILESYEQERKDHAWELIQTALDLGTQIQPIDPDRAAERDAFFTELRRDPSAIQALEHEMSRSILERFLDRGMVVDTGRDTVAGKLLIQPELRKGDCRILLDECLGTGFSIIGYDCDPEEVLSAAMKAKWRDMGATLVRIEPADSGVDGGRLLDEERVLGDWIGLPGASVLLVRPDRFCMACARPDEADVQLGRAYEVFSG